MKFLVENCNFEINILVLIKIIDKKLQNTEFDQFFQIEVKG
jgi:hypothetical protein